MKIKAIIFDFGGPIIEWREPTQRIFRKYEDHRNMQRDTLYDLFRQYQRTGGVGEFHTLREFLEKTKPSLDLTIEEINEVFDEASSACYVRPEMITYIEKLKESYKIALLSNNTSGLEKLLEEVFNIYHLFDVVVNSYNVKIRKPDPSIYNHTLEKLGIHPGEAVFIDDLEENVKAATSLGIKGVVFKDSQQCKLDLDSILNH